MIRDGFSGQGFEIAGRKIFFAELDVVDAGAGGFGDLLAEDAFDERVRLRGKRCGR